MFVWFIQPKCSCQELKQTQQRLQRLREKAWHEKQSTHWMGLTARMVKVLITAYVLTHYNMQIANEIALTYYQKRGKINHGSMVDFPIRDWFMEVSGKSPDLFFDDESKPAVSIRKEAAKMIAEVKTVLWVKHQNFEKELAPSSAAAIHTFKLEATKLDHPELAEAISRSAENGSTHVGRSARRWIQKIRRKWGVSRGVLPCLDAPPKAELVDKAWMTPQAIPSMAMFGIVQIGNVSEA